ncbi:FxsA family protein [bacterium]|nr:FxsA family protein [bacterium]
MLPWLVGLFIGVPHLEVYLLLQVGAFIGVLPTVGLVILTGVCGGLLARYEGLRVLWEARRRLERGEIPSGALSDGLAVLCGGLLLLTPGLLTDLAGLSLLWPTSRRLVKKAVAKWVRNRFNIVPCGPVVIDVSSRGADEGD